MTAPPDPVGEAARLGEPRLDDRRRRHRRLRGVHRRSVALIGFGLDSALEGRAYLSLAVLAGLLGNTLVGAWWLDPLAGLLIAYVAVREGREAWNGEEC